PRSRDAVADHAEGADLRADRWHRRRADHVAAGNPRRSEELGLSVLLAVRRHLHAAGADELGLYRGSLRLAWLAAACGRRRAGPHADHVWHHGPAAALGMGGGLAAGIRGRATRPGR